MNLYLVSTYRTAKGWLLGRVSSLVHGTTAAWVLLVVASLAGLAFPNTAYTQTAGQTCGATGLPSCPPPPAPPNSSGKNCGYPNGSTCLSAPVVIGPWTYRADPRDFNANPPVSTWYSLQDGINWYIDHYTGHGFCTVKFDSLVEGSTPDYPSPEFSALGNILVALAYTANFNITQNDCSTPGSSVMYLLQSRGLSCPIGTSLELFFPPPYSCVFPSPYSNVPKQVGQPCACGPGSSNSGGADGGSAQTIQGNPINASNGNKYQSETDYTGVGLNPVSFVRSYNSLHAWAAANGQVYPMTFLGAGWMASYFQFLQIIPGQAKTNNGTVNLTTVYAYRPDGRLLMFTLNNGIYSPDGDVGDSLLQTSSGEWEYQTNDDTIETYDSNGLLLSVARRGQALITVNYRVGANSGSPPTSVSDAFGHTLVFNYIIDSTGAQRLGSIQDPAGNTVKYAYSNGTLVSATYQDGTSRQYGYGSNTGTALTSLTDEAGVQYATWTYNPSGSQALSSQHAGGVDSYTFSYTSSGSSGSVLVTDPLGAARTFNQQLIQGVWRSSGATASCGTCGEDAARKFDSSGNILSRTDFNGNQTVYTYDVTRNEEISRTEAYGTPLARTITTKWDPNWRQPALITEPNRTTGYTYDSMGNVLTKTITDTTVSPNVTRNWTYTYDTFGRIRTATGPRTDVNDTTTYDYYTCTTGSECGELKTVTDALGHVTTYNTYNAHGQPLKITDPNGAAITLTYDTRQRLTSRSIAGETTTFSYYLTGLLQTVTLPDNSTVTHTYDGAHRLTQISDRLGNNIVYTLDNMGNRIAENTHDPSGALHLTHTRVFNTSNDLYQDINAADTAAVTTTYAYDPNGNQKSVTAPLARNTGEQYDALNRLAQITDPANGITQFGYDANDNLTSVTDPRALATTYTHNGFGDLVSQLSPDTGATTNTYDSAGNLFTSTDARGAVATYTYDVLNRVKSVTYSVGGTADQTTTLTYDLGTNGNGHLTGASDANHSLAWSYDPVGRVINHSQTVAGVTQSVGYGYTSGDLTTLTTPSGQTVTYGYNANHQIINIAVNGATVLNGATYEPLGPVNGWIWGNSTTTARSYDGDGNMAQISSNGQKTLTYDNASRITGITDTGIGSSNWTYGYDFLDRITSGSNGTITHGWSYDANGNRLTETGSSPSTYSIAPASNQITGITGTLARTYGYDAAGHTTNYSDVTATYNDAGRLQSVTRGSQSETLVYNALGQRIETTGGVAGTVLYWYDEQGHLLGEYDGSGNLIEETVWLGDIPVATLRPHTGGGVDIFYVHTDHLNTPRTVTRPSDNMLMWTWYSDPFGTDAANENPAGAGTFVYDLRFAGQVFDGQAGLHANGFRDFDPAIGRYAESDPIGLAGGSSSTYAYVGDDPLSNVDPLGLTALPFDEIQRIVKDNNHSGLSNEIVICLLWNESNFNPKAGGGRRGRGNGLAGVTRTATQQVNLNVGRQAYRYSNWSDAGWSVDVGTRYLAWVLNRPSVSDVTQALQRYGTGVTYPAPQILECEKCLKEQQSRSNVQCSDPNTCLRKVHN